VALACGLEGLRHGGHRVLRPLRTGLVGHTTSRACGHCPRTKRAWHQTRKAPADPLDHAWGPGDVAAMSWRMGKMLDPMDDPKVGSRPFSLSRTSLLGSGPCWELVQTSVLF
jgi:hypothetical protein